MNQHPGQVESLTFPELAHFRSAAYRARQKYPGAVGELLHRELTAYADFGFRLAQDNLVERLVAEILGVGEPVRERAPMRLVAPLGGPPEMAEHLGAPALPVTFSGLAVERSRFDT